MSYVDHPSGTAGLPKGILVTATVAALAATVSVPLIAGQVRQDGLPLFFVLMVVMALAAIGLLALPLTLLMQSMRCESGRAYLLLGAASGGAEIWLIFGDEPVLLACGLFSGGLGGLAWWLSFRQQFQHFGD